MRKLSHLIIHTDGGARGNPGPAASGIYITDTQGNEVAGFGVRLGHSTNNIAEYTAVVEAFRWVIEHRDEFADDLEINFFMDSQLVYSQILGLWKVKNEVLGNLLGNIREKQQRVKANVTYSYVPREKNKDADRYVNLALDNKI